MRVATQHGLGGVHGVLFLRVCQLRRDWAIPAPLPVRVLSSCCALSAHGARGASRSPNSHCPCTRAVLRDGLPLSSAPANSLHGRQLIHSDECRTNISKAPKLGTGCGRQGFHDVRTHFTFKLFSKQCENAWHVCSKLPRAA